ncbi:HNH endonuclease [Leeia sp. TBRC 13508]|uniref:HNH endonuclease n=1 Tax=Leeia speluncae TaxID=2884804 RepID=A0ABS8DBU4_9NEIS|nr:HNH endonuclease domain-containing protein [Leeia speluncae]MCB6185396.1 HNH endonuclease [Leeia speluncae]
MPQHFSNEDYLKGIVLFGLNAATYKMALAKILLEAAKEQKNKIHWSELASSFFQLYKSRLAEKSMPQQGIAHRQTFMERIVQQHQSGKLSESDAIEQVGLKGFIDVIPRFQTIGTNKDIVKEFFYEFQYGSTLTLKDSLLNLSSAQLAELEGEIDARWGLLEGAFSINQSQYHLANDIREIYLQSGYERKPLTNNIPFLSGYQGNICFYCAEHLDSEIHVDHVLPRQVLQHDEVWNLVLSHPECNLLKSDRLVGKHFILKLIARNENIMGSNHPWKAKIAASLGTTPKQRAANLQKHYAKVSTVLGNNYWGGCDSYNPAIDPFYKKLITVLNNESQSI